MNKVSASAAELRRRIRQQAGHVDQPPQHPAGPGLLEQDLAASHLGHRERLTLETQGESRP